jgi:hypothetical protein
MSKSVHRPKEARMSLSLVEVQALDAFKSNVEDLALEELARLDAEREKLEKELGQVKDAIKSVRAVLTAARPASPKHLAKPKAKKQVPFSMSEEREGELVRWLTGNTDEITSKTAKVQFPDWSDSYVNMALKELRETGVLRLAATSGSMNIYRSMV